MWSFAARLMDHEESTYFYRVAFHDGEHRIAHLVFDLRQRVAFPASREGARIPGMYYSLDESSGSVVRAASFTEPRHTSVTFCNSSLH